MRVYSATQKRLIGYGFSAYDIVLAFVAPALALWLRNAPSLAPNAIHYAVGYILISAAFSILAFVAFDVNRGIPEFLSVRDVLKIAQAVFVSEVVTAGTLFVATRLEGVPRTVLVIHALILGAGLFSVRLFGHVIRHRRYLASRAVPATAGESVILIGVSKLSSLYIRLVDTIEEPRQTIVALLDENPQRIGRTVNGVRVWGQPIDLDHVIVEFAQHGVEIDRVLLATKNVLAPEAFASVEATCLRRSIDFGIISELLGFDRLKPLEKPAMAFVPDFERDPERAVRVPHYARYKRALSLALGIPLFALLLPLLLLTSLAAFVDVGMPIFFWQQRIGLHGRSFSVYKLRTLRGPFNRNGERIPEEQRISVIGRLIRKFRFDELPQLLNVLVGDMALIGPRPLLLQDQPHSACTRLLVRPGITGWAQVNGGSLLSAEEKGALDEWYIAHASAWLDLRIVLLTLRSMLWGDRRPDHMLDHASGFVAARESAAGSLAPRSPRIAFLNRYFYPDHSATSQILTDLVVHLAAEGQNVHVFTSRQRYDDAQALLPEAECHRGVTIHRLKTTRFGRAGLVGRTFDYFSFYWSARWALLAWGQPGDILVAKTDPPLLSVLGMYVAKRRSLRLVNWLQDIYPEIASQLGIPLMKGFLGRRLVEWRDASLRAAVANVVVGDRMAAHLRNHGIAPDRIIAIPNWSDDHDIQPIRHSNNPLRRAWQLDGSFVVAYSGNLGRGHEFETVLSAAEILRNEPLLLFLFISNSPKIGELRRLVRERGLSERFRFLPPQERSKLRYSLGAADVHLVSMKSELEGLMVPSKFYGIAASGRPTIAITARDGEVANLVRDHGCGVVVEPGDGAMLACELRALMREPSRLERMGQQARIMLDERFTRQAARARWTRLIDEIVDCAPRNPAPEPVRTFEPPAAAAAEVVTHG